MKRRNYTAEITENGAVIATKTTYAWNSGIKAAEDLMRAYAHGTRTIFEGAKPRVINPDHRTKTYTRVWANAAGKTITASVWEQI